MNPVLRFPVSDDFRRQKALVADVRPEPVLRTLGRDDSRALLEVAKKVHSGLGVLIDFVDNHRDTARDAGVETVAIELGAERKHLESILDTLEESEQAASDAKISLEGLDLLRRSEKLLAEASANINRFTKYVPEQRNLLGQGVMPSSDSLLWGSLLLFGVVGIAVAIIAVNFSGKEVAE